MDQCSYTAYFGKKTIVVVTSQTVELEFSHSSSLLLRQFFQRRAHLLEFLAVASPVLVAEGDLGFVVRPYAEARLRVLEAS